MLSVVTLIHDTTVEIGLSKVDGIEFMRLLRVERVDCHIRVWISPQLVPKLPCVAVGTTVFDVTHFLHSVQHFGGLVQVLGDSLLVFFERF